MWDVRSRAARHKLHAHVAPIKCVALSPHEDKYAIGAADGDIKVSCSLDQCIKQTPMGSYLSHTSGAKRATSALHKKLLLPSETEDDKKWN